MNDAPERIWAQHDTASHMDTLREMAVKPVDEVAQAFTPYLRADLARAAEAAAYERAADNCEAERKALLNFGLSQAAIGASFCERNLRALIGPDAASALDAARAEVRRECAEIARKHPGLRPAEGWSADEKAGFETGVTDMQLAIAAAIMEGKGDE